MKRFTRLILRNCFSISLGALAGFAIVRWYLSSNLFWSILMLPAILFVIYNMYMIYMIEKRRKNI